MPGPITYSNPYAAEEAEIERSRRLAEALRAQSMQPIGDTQFAPGGLAIRRSPLEGFGKLAQAWSANAQGQAAEDRQKALYERQRQDWMGDMTALANNLRGAPAGVDEDAAGNVTERPAVRAGQLNPAVMGQLRTPQMQQVAMQQMLAGLLRDPNAMLGKIDPKDYTPESFRAFVQTGDATQLRPRVKQEAVNTGGSTQFVDPYNPPAQIAHTMGPDAAARLQWSQYEFNNLSANQKAELTNRAQQLGVSVAELMFNTGQRPAGAGAAIQPNAPMPNFGGMAPTQNVQAPMNAPPLPQPQRRVPVPLPAPQPAAAAAPQPAPAPALPPKALQDIEVDKRKKQAEMEAKRQFNMGGINDALNTAERILKGGSKDATLGGKQSNAPTQSMAGSAADWLGSVVGYAPAGAAEADQLRSIGGALVAKMPRMEGPQSDKDVAMYREMAGQIGDSTLPTSRRLAALRTVRELYAKYEHLNGGSATAGGWKDL